MPESLHLLFIGPEEPAWTVLTLQLEERGTRTCRFRWLCELGDAARLLHQEHFDCIVIDDATPGAADSRCPDHPTTSADRDVLDVIAAMRTGGCQDPILMLSDRVDDHWLAAVATAGIELLTVRVGCSSAAVVPWIQRTIERHRSAREFQELRARQFDASRRHGSQTDDQLDLRRRLSARLRNKSPEHEQRPVDDELRAEYIGVLQASLMSDELDTAERLQRLAVQLGRGRYSAADVWQLHLSALDQLVAGLGARSGQHVWPQAELAVVEILARLHDDFLPGRAFRNVTDSGLELPD